MPVRLIDADALKFEIINKPSEFNALESTIDFLSGMAHRTHEVLDILKEAQTVDAVPVVRCKDCKYYDLFGDTGMDCIHTGGLCGYVRPNSFCSYGIRKDKENG